MAHAPYIASSGLPKILRGLYQSPHERMSCLLQNLALSILRCSGRRGGVHRNSKSTQVPRPKPGWLTQGWRALGTPQLGLTTGLQSLMLTPSALHVQYHHSALEVAVLKWQSHRGSWGRLPCLSFPLSDRDIFHVVTSHAPLAWAGEAACFWEAGVVEVNRAWKTAGLAASIPGDPRGSEH